MSIGARIGGRNGAHLAWPAGAALLLAACSGPIGEAERSAPPGDAFAAELRAGYIALANAEHDESDFVDARAFAGRAQRAARGAAPEPEALSARRLPSASVPGLAAARERLVRALDRGARASAPHGAARAQLAYECWLQEQEEDIQPDDIAKCRTGFETALASVEAELAAAAEPAAGQAGGGQAGRVRPSLSPASVVVNEPPATSLATRFVVYFDFDASAIDPGSVEEISRAAAAARRTGAAMVRVVGHADRAGPARHNMSLSRSRAQEVVRALRRLGLPEIGVATQAAGEEAPAVSTRDGVREPRNRRVEIELAH